MVETDAEELTILQGQWVVSSEKRREEIKFHEPIPLQTYDGSEDFVEYLVQFAAIVSLMNQRPTQKATILLGRLKSLALPMAASPCDPTFNR